MKAPPHVVFLSDSFTGHVNPTLPVVSAMKERCLEAVDDDVLVVMTVGPRPDALEGLPPLPANFIVRQAVPQLDVLE